MGCGASKGICAAEDGVVSPVSNSVASLGSPSNKNRSPQPAPATGGSNGNPLEVPSGKKPGGSFSSSSRVGRSVSGESSTSSNAARNSGSHRYVNANAHHAASDTAANGTVTHLLANVQALPATMNSFNAIACRTREEDELSDISSRGSTSHNTRPDSANTGGGGFAMNPRNSRSGTRFGGKGLEFDREEEVNTVEEFLFVYDDVKLHRPPQVRMNKHKALTKTKLPQDMDEFTAGNGASSNDSVNGASTIPTLGSGGNHRLVSGVPTPRMGGGPSSGKSQVFVFSDFVLPVVDELAFSMNNTATDSIAPNASGRNDESSPNMSGLFSTSTLVASAAAAAGSTGGFPAAASTLHLPSAPQQQQGAQGEGSGGLAAHSPNSPNAPSRELQQLSSNLSTMLLGSSAGADTSGGLATPIKGVGGDLSAGSVNSSFNSNTPLITASVLKAAASVSASTSVPSVMLANGTVCRATNVCNNKARQAFLIQKARAIAAKGYSTIHSFDVEHHIGHHCRVKCIAIAPGDNEFVSCSNEDPIVTLISAKSGQEVSSFAGHQDTVISATFSADGKYLATTSRDNTMILWDVVTAKQILQFDHAKVVICCTFSRDSRFVATGCQDKVCRLWETRKGRETVFFPDHDGIIISMSYSPDNCYVASASADKTVRVWSATTGKARHVLRGHSGIVLSCAHTNDGLRIISNDEKLVKVWDVATGACQRTIAVEEFVTGIALNGGPDGGGANAGGAMGGHGGMMQNNSPASIQTRKLTWTLSCVAPGFFTKFILVACNNRFVYVIDITTGKEVASYFCKAPVYCLTSGFQNMAAFGDSFGNLYLAQIQ